MLLALCTGTGCGTLIARIGPGRPGPFPGVAVDAFLITETFPTLLILFPVFLVDLTLCALVDTLLLPIDLARERDPEPSPPEEADPPPEEAPRVPGEWSRLAWPVPDPAGTKSIRATPWVVPGPRGNVDAKRWSPSETSREAHLRRTAIRGAHRYPGVGRDAPGASISPLGDLAICDVRGEPFLSLIGGQVGAVPRLQLDVWELAGSAVSPDGKRWLVSDLSTSCVFLGDAERLVQLQGEVRGAHALAFDPEQRWIAAGGTDGAVRVWEGADGGEPRLLAGPNRTWVSAIAFLPDGSLLAGHADGEVRRWTVLEGTSAQLAKEPGMVLALVAGPDGTFFSAGAWPRLVHRKVEGGAQLRELGHDFGVVVHVAADDERVAVAGDREHVVIWDATTGEEWDRVSLAGLQDQPRALALRDGAGNPGLTIVTREGAVLSYRAGD